MRIKVTLITQIICYAYILELCKTSIIYSHNMVFIAKWVLHEVSFNIYDLT